MSIFSSVLTVLQILSALSIIVLVLLQHGKGADMGSGFGSGAASLFGASGSANFLSRMTKWSAVVFFAATAGMAYVATRKPVAPGLGIMETSTSQAAPAVKNNEVPNLPASSNPTSPTPSPSAASTAPATALPAKPAVPAVPLPLAPATPPRSAVNPEAPAP